jgi:hypothetical protein
MERAVFGVMPKPDDIRAMRDDGADHRVRRRPSPPLSRKRERGTHVLSVDPARGPRSATRFTMLSHAHEE